MVHFERNPAIIDAKVIWPNLVVGPLIDTGIVWPKRPVLLLGLEHHRSDVAAFAYSMRRMRMVECVNQLHSTGSQSLRKRSHTSAAR